MMLRVFMHIFIKWKKKKKKLVFYFLSLNSILAFEGRCELKGRAKSIFIIYNMSGSFK